MTPIETRRDDLTRRMLTLLLERWPKQLSRSELQCIFEVCDAAAGSITSGAEAAKKDAEKEEPECPET